ncbi:conserved protein of unknown function [Pseudodesulfovibrio profundus]|uniref:PD-(D/E)XK endonuclease-like domain-containing protein n=1 Tax=Pseudodesulfovibrio profundus TaxID=57320 RepID=A0A2C8F604_9BACT|nr:PD-(D/E)XK nuclease family protein [Pseudodesulfovibrio profundus]SOB57858.1 conserved protein of unknown function [Pseudodesulfovibrio profundus]
MNPIHLIPWQQDFISALGELLLDRPDFSQCTVVLPHNRPRLYLKEYFKNNGGFNGPVMLPRMVSISDFVTEIRRDLTDASVMNAHQLDLVELLYGIVTELRQSGKGLLARLPELNREDFLPWGIRLAKLMDDLLRQDIEPEDLTYLEGEVAPYAVGLLEQISTIHRLYILRLSEKNWTTPGLDWRYITSNINDAAEMQAGKSIIAAGFYALSGTENIFFQRLWSDGILHPILHSDPALARKETSHWAVSEHKAWLRRWRASAVIPETVVEREHQPAIRFCEGFDRHSQLAALSDDLEGSQLLTDSAVILPDEGALMPVMHHLPEADINISMGYPLARTSLARLIETILQLQENRLDDGRYYWRDIVDLIRHPYLRLLGPEDKPLRKVFHVWEAEIRIGERHISPLAYMPPYGDTVLEGVDEGTTEALRKSILDHCLMAFESVSNLETLGNALNSLAAMLHEHGHQLWLDYLVDAECLFRLTTSIIPELRSVENRTEPYSQSTLFALLRRLLSQERVSFEPEPLGGLQVMGVLETRLLHFRRLFILDAVEERLPGTDAYDPLLPDPLRKLLGLPDARERDNVSGYNFYRLLMGADEAVIYYQNGIQPGLLDSKSSRSRFVEQLLWEREQKEQRIIEPGDPLIRTMTFSVGALVNDSKAISITSTIRDQLHALLVDQGLSPSRIDRYMHCPKQFYYSDLCKVRPIKQVDEDGDRSEFGSLLHDVLREFHEPFIGRKVDFKHVDSASLLSLFDERLKSSSFYRQLALDTRMALRKTGHFRLEQYLDSLEPTTLLGLEDQLRTALFVDGKDIPINGQLDRIEERDEGVVILDYKTGGGVLPRKNMWEDMELWDRVHDFKTEENDVDLLADIAQSVQSVQLPLYMYLYLNEKNQTPHDAGLIKLAENGKSEFAFGPKWTDQERHEAIESMTPTLISCIIRHMMTTDQFSPNPGKRCEWCDFKIPCGQ